ncbi:hypothetical protein DAPPUDRAFT_340394, partial [Daphnia pulex]
FTSAKLIEMKPNVGCVIDSMTTNRCLHLPMSFHLAQIYFADLAQGHELEHDLYLVLRRIGPRFDFSLSEQLHRR